MIQKNRLLQYSLLPGKHICTYRLKSKHCAPSNNAPHQKKSFYRLETKNNCSGNKRSHLHTMHTLTEQKPHYALHPPHRHDFLATLQCMHKHPFSVGLCQELFLLIKGQQISEVFSHCPHGLGGDPVTITDHFVFSSLLFKSLQLLDELLAFFERC